MIKSKYLYEISIIMLTPYERITDYNYCYVKNCMMPRHNILFCKNHTYKNPNMACVNEIKLYFEKKNNLQKIGKKRKTKEIIEFINNVFNIYSGISPDDNTIQKSILDANIFFLNNKKKILYHECIFENIAGYRQLIHFSRTSEGMSFTTENNDNAIQNYIAKRARELFYNKKCISGKHKNISIPKICSELCKNICDNSICDNMTKTLNYNGKLYTEFIKFINDESGCAVDKKNENIYDIIYYKREKSFQDLTVPSKLADIMNLISHIIPDKNYDGEYNWNELLTFELEEKIGKDASAKVTSIFDSELQNMLKRPCDRKKTRLRFDLYGIMIIDTQFYHFLIELDDEGHFDYYKKNDKGDKYTRMKYDIKKEIYAWNNCISLLRIHCKDNIYKQIESFLRDIKLYKKPIIRYSNIEKYENRITHIESIKDDMHNSNYYIDRLLYKYKK